MSAITWYFFHYMVPLPWVVKAEIVRCGSEKPDYRNRDRLLQCANIVGVCSKSAGRPECVAERAPRQEGLTPQTIIVGRNNDLVWLHR
jgi:hypothetical protein